MNRAITLIAILNISLSVFFPYSTLPQEKSPTWVYFSPKEGVQAVIPIRARTIQATTLA